ARARIIVPALVGSDVHRTELPLPHRIVDAGLKALLLLLHADFEPQLYQDDAGVDDVLFDLRAELEEPMMLLLADEPHDVFDASAVVPAAIEDDDFAAGGEIFHVPLQEHLRFLAIRGGREGHYAEHPRAHPLGDGLDRPALAGGVAPLEYDDHPRTGLAR